MVQFDILVRILLRIWMLQHLKMQRGSYKFLAVHNDRFLQVPVVATEINFVKFDSVINFLSFFVKFDRVCQN